MPAQQGLWLDKEEGLSPGPNRPGQQHKKKPVCLPVDGAFYLSTQNDQLVSQERVFRQQFGFASGQIDERAEHKRGRRWFHPVQSTFTEHIKDPTDVSLDRGK